MITVFDKMNKFARGVTGIKSLLLSVITILCLTGCTSFDARKGSIADLARDYFSVYAARTEFDRFMSFYAENAQLEDIIYGNFLQNKSGIREFLNWDRGSYRVLGGKNALIVTAQYVDGNTVVTEGYFSAFEYDGKTLGPWLFVIVLEFNHENKIVRQTDWINYTPRESFLGGENRNDKIPLR